MGSETRTHVEAVFDEAVDLLATLVEHAHRLEGDDSAFALELGLRAGNVSRRLGNARDAQRELSRIGGELYNRWSNTRPGSPHRVIDHVDADKLRRALELARAVPASSPVYCRGSGRRGINPRLGGQGTVWFADCPVCSAQVNIDPRTDVLREHRELSNGKA